ncbi:MAG: Smr/MutS family protein [Deltaproteobacteria bacterium]|nr:Smr/MutS family protein [Deltaproteobacteria bacterium]
MNEPDPIDYPINGILDLHTFRPNEVKDLIPEYLAACRRQGILQVRIIHGKGSGTLRRTLQAILTRRPEVASFQLAGEEAGGWGATIVRLNPQPPEAKDEGRFKNEGFKCII